MRGGRGVGGDVFHMNNTRPAPTVQDEMESRKPVADEEIKVANNMEGFRVVL